MRVDLEHIGKVDVGQRGVVRRDVVLVIHRHDRLGVGRLPLVHLRHPRFIEVGVQLLDIGGVLVEHLRRALAEQRVIHRQVVAQIEQAAAPVLGGVNQVGMLNRGEEGVVGFEDAHPVGAFDHLVVEGEDEAGRAISLTPVVLRHVVGGQPLGQPHKQAAGEGANQAVEAKLAAIVQLD